VRLHVHAWGDPDSSPPLVCLHGVTAHGPHFRRLAEERLAARYRVLAPDLRGHGRSGWEPPWTIEAHLDDLVETLGERSAIWVGHSFGGRLVLELATRRPELVERAVLLDPAIQLLPHVGFDMAELSRPDRVYASLAEAVERRYAESRLILTPRALLEEELAEHLVPDGDGNLRYRYCQSTVVAAYGEMTRDAPPWERLHAPTLLVVGAESWILLDHLLDGFRTTLGERATVATVPGGHTVLWEAFDETAAAVAAFLDD